MSTDDDDNDDNDDDNDDNDDDDWRVQSSECMMHLSQFRGQFIIRAVLKANRLQ